MLPLLLLCAAALSRRSPDSANPVAVVPQVLRANGPGADISEFKTERADAAQASAHAALPTFGSKPWQRR